tara:strand:+ start:910 stop:1089 length:180 start_codon:yes stop_codon:yes gene_type:complete
MALTNDEVQKINDIYKQLDEKDAQIAALTEQLSKFDIIIEKLEGLAAAVSKPAAKTAKK